MLRPACRRCTARRGIIGPVACYLPPHLTVCRRHRLWIGPSARSHAGQLDVSQLPDIFRAQRCHLAQLHHHRWREVEAAISDATHAIHSALRAGAWTPRQRQRLHQLDPGTWPEAAPGPGPGWQYNLSGNPVIEIAIYRDVIRLAAHTLRAHSASDDAAPERPGQRPGTESATLRRCNDRSQHPASACHGAGLPPRPGPARTSTRP